MTDTTAAMTPRRSVAQWIVVIGLAAAGILALVAAVLYVAGAANSIHFLSGSVHHGRHAIRMTICLVAGVILLVGASYYARSTKPRT
jgi:hypothetical protein